MQLVGLFRREAAWKLSAFFLVLFWPTVVLNGALWSLWIAGRRKHSRAVAAESARKVKNKYSNPSVVCYDTLIKLQWRDFPMGDKVSLFDNERKMAWMRYFSEKTALDVEALKLIDVSVKNKNLIPAVEANRVVLAFAGETRPTLFYDMWNAGLGACDVWLKEGLDPEGEVSSCKVSSCIDRGIAGHTVLLIVNEQADSAYKIGLQNKRFFQRIGSVCCP